MAMPHNLLLYGSRIVVPASLQKDTLEKIHQGHQGIKRCRMRAQICLVAWDLYTDQGNGTTLHHLRRAFPTTV